MRFKQFYSGAGFGNRIKGIVSSWRQDDLLADQTSFYWAVSPLVHCHYNDLFTTPLRQHEEPKGEIASWRLWVTEQDVSPSFATVRPSDGPSIDLEYSRIPRRVRDAYIPYFKRLLVKPEISAEAITESVGVFMRAGKDWVKAGRSISPEAYFIKIDQLNPDRFFLSCQEQAVIDQFKERYGCRVVTLENTSQNYAGTIRGIRATIDWLSLSKCSVLIGDYLSTFLETAWWYGGCTATVHTIKK